MSKPSSNRLVPSSETVLGGTASPNGATNPKSHQPLTTRLRPRASTLAVCLLACRFARPSPSSRLVRRLAHWLVLWMAVLNWRAVPFYWHVMTLFPVLVVKFRRWRLGSNNEQFVKALGVIGSSPFEARTISRHCATWNTCDFMLHMSNSAYAIALDEVRTIWHVNMIGIAMRSDLECVRPMVASTHFTYFVEIPMLADYEVEIRPVAWDNKWLYLLATFTTAPPKGSQTRTLNCLSITRTVNKIGRRTVPPAKLFAISGFGKSHSTWDHICTLRRQSPGSKKATKLRPTQQWLLDGEPVEGFDEYEDTRKRNLEIVKGALDGDPLVGAERLKEL